MTRLYPVPVLLVTKFMLGWRSRALKSHLGYVQLANAGAI